MRVVSMVMIVVLLALAFMLIGGNKGCGPTLKIGGGRPTTPGGYIDRGFGQPARAVTPNIIPGTGWVGGDLDTVGAWENNPDAVVTTGKTSFKFGIYPAVPMVDSGFIQMTVYNIDDSNVMGSATYLATANLGSERDPCTLSEWQVTIPVVGRYAITTGDDSRWFVWVK